MNHLHDVGMKLGLKGMTWASSRYWGKDFRLIDNRFEDSRSLSENLYYVCQSLSVSLSLYFYFLLFPFFPFFLWKVVDTWIRNSKLVFSMRRPFEKVLEGYVPTCKIF